MTINQTNENIKVSVIVPMYYCEDFVVDLLDSMCRQDFRDIEIICVVDGSPDNTLKCCEEYAKKDSRISVLYQEHKGAGAARNLGIKHARGEYLMFPDVDDVYADNYISKMYDAIHNNGADIAVCQFYSYDLVLDIKQKLCGFGAIFKPKNKSISTKGIKGLLKRISNIPHIKIFRRKLIEDNQLWFSETPSINDLFFTSTYLACAESIVFIDSHLVTYRKHKNPRSISTSRGENPRDLVYVYRELYAWLKERGLLVKYLKDYYLKWNGDLRNYARYCKDEVFVNSVVSDLINEEPWRDMSDRELRCNTMLFTSFPKHGLKKQRKLLKNNNLSQEKRKAIETRCRFIEQEIYNLERIRTILEQKYGKNMRIKDNYLSYRLAQVRQAGLLYTIEIIYGKLIRRMI